MCQVSQSNGSTTLLISKMTDMPRHPSTRILSKAEDITPAGYSPSSTEIGLYAELPMFKFSSHK